MFQASDFLTIALLVALEGLLSADNAMVLAVLVLGLPKRDQKKALRYGILGAFAFRTIATLLAVYLIKLGWVKLAGAAYLLYLAFKHFFLTDAEERRKAPPARPAFGLSAFWSTVVKVELTDIVFVELPQLKRELKAGDSCAVVESVKTASDIYSPVSGQVVEVNQAVVDNPALANTEPYGGGWFFKIKLANPAELGGLITPEQYKAQVGG